jgi:lysophospholipase L1-like esterase
LLSAHRGGGSGAPRAGAARAAHRTAGADTRSGKPACLRLSRRPVGQLNEQSLMKKLAIHTALIVCSVIFSLVVAELLLRAFRVGYGNSPLDNDPYLHHRHPRDYSFLSHTPSKEYGGHAVYYDQHGLVFDGRKNKVRSCEIKYRVAFLGDSFTEAIQVAHRDSFVGLLDALNCNTETLNFGVSSYSPALYFIQWNTTVKNFNPTHVIVQLYSNDISDDKTYISRATFDPYGNLVAVPGNADRGASILVREFYLIRFIRKVQLQLAWAFAHYGKEQTIIDGYVEENPDITDTSAQFIKKLKDQASSAGAHFYLTVIPSKFRVESASRTYDELEFSQKLEHWAREQGIDFIDLVEPFRKARRETNGPLFYKKDIHLNKKGHRVAADAISSLIPHVFSSGDGVAQQGLAGDRQ